jgi:hypothetical protein
MLFDSSNVHLIDYPKGLISKMIKIQGMEIRHLKEMMLQVPKSDSLGQEMILEIT